MLLAVVLGLSLAGCASKAKQDASGKSAMSYKGEVRSAAEQGALEREALEGHNTPDAAAAANPNSGVKGTLSKGFAGTWDSEVGANVAGSQRRDSTSTSGNTGRENVPAGNEWERDLLSGLDQNSSSASRLADRVAAARQHALDVARETEDATLYSALTGGRDLHEDLATEHALAVARETEDATLDPARTGGRDLHEGLATEHALDVAHETEDATLYSELTGGLDLHEHFATERALAAKEFPDFDPNRDYQKRGFFDEEEYAFAPGMSKAERMAARVEAARRRAGLTDTDEEAVAAFAYGPYSRIYQHEGDVSGLIVADESGKVKGWAAPGELTADGTVFAGGASEKTLADLQAGRRGRKRNGAIDVAASKANVNEDFIPQTLGGALPIVLGVEQNGQFDFDNYFLRDEVKAKLDDLARQLEGAEYDRLDVLGYTDRIGGVDYNKDLSRKRAMAVARHLRDRGVPEYKIMVTGKGQENPLTRYEDCEGLLSEEKINCLQPDRRVEIEASILRTSVEIE